MPDIGNKNNNQSLCVPDIIGGAPQFGLTMRLAFLLFVLCLVPPVFAGDVGSSVPNDGLISITGANPSMYADETEPTSNRTSWIDSDLRECYVERVAPYVYRSAISPISSSYSFGEPAHWWVRRKEGFFRYGLWELEDERIHEDLDLMGKLRRWSDVR